LTSGPDHRVSLPLGEAIGLGALQGPCELLPISSSAHLGLLPSIGGWRYAELDPELRKSFEIALHAGTALALGVALRHELWRSMRNLDLRRLSVIGLSFIPPAIVGLAAERQIESRGGDPAWLAGGLIAGSAMMVAADTRPQGRSEGDAGPVDGLLLGIAQAGALIPGISRNGATLSAARARCFTRDQANLLSRTVALPVIAGATLLKGVRLARRGLSPDLRRAFAVGTLASFVSTLASKRLIDLVERDRALWPYAAYRVLLAAIAITPLARGLRRPNVLNHHR